VAGAAFDRDPGRGSPEAAAPSAAPLPLPEALLPPGAPAGDPRRDAIALRVKFALDRAAAVLGLVTLAPLLLVLVVAIRLTGGGRAITGVTHWTLDGRSFQRLGLRTTGHARLDAFLRRGGLRHLPELINVARGELSIVGPRPRRLEVAAQPGLPATHLRSGLTGWAQLQQPVDPAAERALDAAYVERWSLRLDARMLWRTLTRHA
jgi:lipopolysaccharide/colanic/teichoic acid biosynthesis glycosyltransferase